MKTSLRILLAGGVLLNSSLSFAQERKCNALEAEFKSIKDEDERLKAAFGDSLGKPEIQPIVCKNLNDQIRLNSRMAQIFKKCVNEGFAGFEVAAATMEREIIEVYGKTARQYNCQRIEN